MIENKFHNLQSLYDTYLSDSDIEDQDANLRLMRGHVSIIFYLLQTATDITHYYERHMTVPSSKPQLQVRFPVTHTELLGLLMNYSIAFAHRFIKAAQISVTTSSGSTPTNGRCAFREKRAVRETGDAAGAASFRTGGRQRNSQVTATGAGS